MKIRALVTFVTAAMVAGRAWGADVGVIHIDGPIGPATASYISRALQVAADQKDECLVITLDTPGGLVTSTEKIVESFDASPVPTVVYVSPSGGNAWSAGTFITLAANIAAMAPNTTIGAAHPVSMNPTGDVEKQDDVMKEKVENALSTWMKSIAQKRNRDVEWAMSAVKESQAITDDEALQKKVIDLIADDMPDLLQQINGREINGRKLNTLNATTVEIPMTAREKVFQALWRPEVMFVLMLMAMYGIIGELSSPGAILPGVVGGIALVLMLYMAEILPINAAGLALVGLAILLFVVDVFSPTHGILTGGGIIAFFLGALMLFDRSDPAFRLSLGLIIPATVVTALFFIFIVGAGWRAQRLPVRAGSETMLGKVVPAQAAIDAAGGKVFIEGELWNAVSEVAVAKDQLVEVVGINGLTLKVKPKT